MASQASKKLIFYGTLGAICALGFVLRIPSFDFPLDYDVGGHLFYGMQVATRDFYSTLQEIRPVGMLTIFALIYKIFGSSTAWVNAVGASFWIFSTFLVFKITEEIANSRRVAIFAPLIFVFLSSSRALQGEMANMEAFFIPFNLLGVYLFLLYKRKAKRMLLVLSGFSFGVAFLIKHLAAFDFLAVFLFDLFLIFSPKGILFELEKKIKILIGESITLVLGFFIPTLLVIFYFLIIGQLRDFFYWQFIKIYTNTSGFYLLGSPLINLKNNFLPIFAKTYPFWLLSLLGISVTLIFKREVRRFFLFFWVAIVFGGIYYLWWFFPHHFLQLTPPISIFAGLFLSDISNLGEGKLNKLWLLVKNEFLIVALLLSLVLVFKADSPYFVSYFRRLKGEVSEKQHLAAVGFDIGPDGWLPFYETADYFKEKTKPEETVFIWGSVPTIYALAEKQPISWFVYKYPLLPDELRNRTFKGWFPNVSENRERLMEELTLESPDYVVLEFDPEKVFDEIISFSDFSRFVYKNYEFNRSIGGRFLIYRKKDWLDKVAISKGDSSLVPLEVVKRYAAITEITTREGKTEITLEPMVNPDGVLRSFEVVYPEVIELDFEPMFAEFLGPDGSDLVGNAIPKPSGVVDLHIRVRGLSKPVSFVRVKMDEITWNSRQYGVNLALKVFQTKEGFDLYFEQPSNWEGKTFSVYIIYEDGLISNRNIVD